MSDDPYRGQLRAALTRVALLEGELAAFHSDPAHERVVVAEERLREAENHHLEAVRAQPYVLLASLAMLGAAGVAWGADARWLQGLAMALAFIGGSGAIGTFFVALTMRMRGPRPAYLVALEREVRIAKADVGARQRERRLRGVRVGGVDADLEEREDTLDDTASSDHRQGRRARLS